MPNAEARLKYGKQGKEHIDQKQDEKKTVMDETPMKETELEKVSGGNRMDPGTFFNTVINVITK